MKTTPISAEQALRIKERLIEAETQPTRYESLGSGRFFDWRTLRFRSSEKLYFAPIKGEHSPGISPIFQFEELRNLAHDSYKWWALPDIKINSIVRYKQLMERHGYVSDRPRVGYVTFRNRSGVDEAFAPLHDGFTVSIAMTREGGFIVTVTGPVREADVIHPDDELRWNSITKLNFR